MPYCKNDMKNALIYGVINVVVESKCLTLRRIPQDLASFLESSAMWYFPFNILHPGNVLFVYFDTNTRWG